MEVTNNCNAKCIYCPQPKMKRKKGFMSMETYVKVLEKQELEFIELHGFGEPLMHPRIYDFVKMAKEKGFKSQFSTNGKLLNREVMEKLVEAGLVLLLISIRSFFNEVKEKLMAVDDEYSKKMEIVIYYVEFPEKMKPLPEHWRKTHVIPHTWSGHVDLQFIKRYESCFNLANKAVTVLWDGRISNCCHDVEGRYILGTIDDDNLEPKVNDLCENCEFHGKPK